MKLLNIQHNRSRFQFKQILSISRAPLGGIYQRTFTFEYQNKFVNRCFRIEHEFIKIDSIHKYKNIYLPLVGCTPPRQLKQ